MKKVRKVFKILLISLAVLLLVLIVTPFLFKDQILELTKKTLNEQLNARVDFSDLGLSFIRDFPDARITLDNLTVVGTGQFEADTLLSLRQLYVSVDLLSVIKMSNIEVKAITLDEPRIVAHVAKDGKANWDIMKESTAPQAQDTTSQGSSDVKVALRKFEIRKAYIHYMDDTAKMRAGVYNLNYVLHGDLSTDYADLDMRMDIDGVDFWMDGVRMLHHARVALVSTLGANLKDMEFVFKENEFRINDIALRFDGKVRMPTDDIYTDVVFASGDIGFKSVLSMVPAIYLKDFETIQTKGIFSLSGSVIGVYNDKQMPRVNIDLKIKDAMFKYPDLPKSVDNINVHALVFYDGENNDRSTVDVNRLHIEMAGNPFDAELHVRTPMSDMHVAAKMAGHINLNSVNEIMPIDDIRLNGALDCNLSLAGYLSTLDKKEYEKFDAKGYLNLTGFVYDTPDLPRTVINKASLNFTPRKVDLTQFSATIGRSSVAMQGSIENFIAYVFRNETIKGKVNLSSPLIDLNELMGSDTSTATQPADTSAMAIIEVPKNIDFEVNANIQTILYDKLKIANTKGYLYVRNGKVRMDKLGMDMLGGSLTMSGEYSTEDMSKPSADLNLIISNFDIPSTLGSFATLESIFPEPQNYTGRVSAGINMYTLLDPTMSPVLNSILAKGDLHTRSLALRNSKLMGALADLSKRENLRNPTLGNVDVRFEVKDGQILFEPVHFNIDQAKVVVSGSQGLDQSLHYTVQATVPTPAQVKSVAQELTITGKVLGTVKKPEVKLDLGNTVQNIIKEQVQVVKEKVTEELRKQADQVLKEAETLAAQVRSQGKVLADKTRAEAKVAAEQVKKKASSPVEQALAKVAADKLVQEGEVAAKKIEQEAAANADKALSEAKKRADDILLGKK